MRQFLDPILIYWGGGGGGGGTPYNDLQGEALPERGTFFRFQVYERVGISLVERVVNSVILVCNKAQKDKQVDFMAVKKFRKCSGLRVIHIS